MTKHCLNELIPVRLRQFLVNIINSLFYYNVYDYYLFIRFIMNQMNQIRARTLDIDWYQLLLVFMAGVFDPK